MIEPASAVQDFVQDFISDGLMLGLDDHSGLLNLNDSTIL